MKKINLAKIKKTCTLHHTAAHRGYVSRKSEGVANEYSGKFGTGYTIDRPRWDTTNYVDREYWILKEEN